VLDAVFSEGAGGAADSLLLAQLLEQRERCISDGAYVDQARRHPPIARALGSQRAARQVAGVDASISNSRRGGVVLAGMLGLCAAASGLLDIREMRAIETSAIATAPPGYVELKGTLHVLGAAEPEIAPQSKARSVWYEIARRSGIKGSSTTYERSANSFVVRDATGDAVIDPTGITVHTRHFTTSIGSGDAALGSGRRVSEKSLREGDEAYVLGELSVTTAPDGRAVRHVRIAENGRRLLVSNLSEGQLVFAARVWLWIGAVVAASSLIILIWAWHQRYHVINAPGIL
jgi:hypothetical protein